MRTVIPALFLAAALCAGCGGGTDAAASARPRLTQEAVEEARTLITDLRLPEASGERVLRQAGFTLDYSNAGQGYVMLRGEETDRRVKVSISLGEEKYYYDMPTDGRWVTFPLQQGSGAYSVRVLERVEGTSYALVWDQSVTADIQDELDPFTYPGQLVDYDGDTDAVAWGFALCQKAGDDGARADAIYRYVAGSIRYDTQKAETVQSGYLPDVDDTLWTGRGICFDYASLLAAMLRSQGVPTQMIFGYVAPDDEYHAWNLVYLDGDWLLRDATLDGSGRKNGDYQPTARY